MDSLPGDLEAKSSEWRAPPDDRARVTAALRLVQDDVRYFGIEMGDNTHRPHAPAETWQRRFGDCKDKVYLLVALLDRMGIEAVPALVATDRGKALAGFVPSASVFDHVIARAVVGGETLWMDPTITLQGGLAGEYDLADYGAALAIFPGNGRIEPIESPRGNANGNGIAVVERYTPLAGRATSASKSRRSIVVRDSADRRRRSLAGERADEIRAAMPITTASAWANSEVLAPPLVEDDRDCNLMKVVERYRLKRRSTTKARRSRPGHLCRCLAVHDRPAAVDDARFAVVVHHRGSDRHEIEVVLPGTLDADLRQEHRRLRRRRSTTSAGRGGRARRSWCTRWT